MNQRTQQPPLFPIDKSFAQAVPATTLAALAKNFWLLVPSAFYYEVFDGEAKKRPSALKGLDQFRRVDLGTLLQCETKTGNPIEEADSGPLSFNPVVLSPEWMLTDELSAVMQDYKTNVVDPALVFWNEIISTRQVAGFTTEEIKAVSGTESEFTNLCTILRDRTRIRRAASIIGFPFSDLLTESWFHFRHFQASLLNALILLRRYPDPQTPRDQLKLEHDVHDMEYLTLGLITGHLATAETSKHFSNFSMKWRFGLLRPDGELVTPDSVTALLQSYVTVEAEYEMLKALHDHLGLSMGRGTKTAVKSRKRSPRGKIKKVVLTYLEKNGRGKAIEIAKLSGLKVTSVNQTLFGLKKSGHITQGKKRGSPFVLAKK